MFVVGGPVPFLKWYNFVKKQEEKKTNVEKNKTKNVFENPRESSFPHSESNIKKTRSTPNKCLKKHPSILVLPKYQ